MFIETLTLGGIKLMMKDMKLKIEPFEFIQWWS